MHKLVHQCTLDEDTIVLVMSLLSNEDKNLTQRPVNDVIMMSYNLLLTPEYPAILLNTCSLGE